MMKKYLGFTLIEILVVIFIISIVALATTLSVGSIRSANTVKQQAAQLQQIIKLTAETALVEQVDLGIGIWSTGFAVWRYDYAQEKWFRLIDDVALKTYELPKPLQLTLVVNQQSIVVPNTMNAIKIPQLGFTGTGRATPASIKVSNGDVEYTVAVAANGEVKIVEPQ